MTIKLSQDQKEQIKETLKEYFYNERAEEIGDLAAETLLDLISKEIGPHFYNQGVKDAKGMVEQKVMNLDEDIQSLERPILRGRN
ncbi:DUF2164 domain-containing protein [Halalkalibacillus sediminis]|uniref:DUF2164 domain-containing protein n=1 Tax=Halalkalibacillus sediminis TaxID=2018042 RepID=A0A2I0QR65_9BACI|nr:DUF2164 domain-containing protein [Halalkalibacillus sediminis]PKR76827.1 DUF2164 domain-containing protein [Halalkalibacillus sediminis]